LRKTWFRIKHAATVNPAKTLIHRHRVAFGTSALGIKMTT